MKKKVSKYIREISDRLPPVYEQTVSGYYEDYNQEGELVKFPNIIVHPVNHERRIRRAYERLGMEGILNYLTSIQELQKQRHDKNKDLVHPDADARVDHLVQGPDAGSGDSNAAAGVPVQDTPEELGENQRGDKGDGGASDEVH